MSVLKPLMAHETREQQMQADSMNRLVALMSKIEARQDSPLPWPTGYLRARLPEHISHVERERTATEWWHSSLLDDARHLANGYC